MVQSDRKLNCKKASHYILNCTERGFRRAFDDGVNFVETVQFAAQRLCHPIPGSLEIPLVLYPTKIVILTLPVNNNRLYSQSEIQKILMMVFQ